MAKTLAELALACQARAHLREFHFLAEVATALRRADGALGEARDRLQGIADYRDRKAHALPLVEQAIALIDDVRAEPARDPRSET